MSAQFTVIAWYTISAAVTHHHHSPIRHSFPLWFLAGDSISISLSFYWFLGSLVQHGPVLYQSSGFIDQKERKEEKRRDKERKAITPWSWVHLWVSPVVRRIFSFGFKPFQDGRIPIDSEESHCPLWWFLLYFQASSLFLFLLVRKLNACIWKTFLYVCCAGLLKATPPASYKLSKHHYLQIHTETTCSARNSKQSWQSNKS